MWVRDSSYRTYSTRELRLARGSRGKLFALLQSTDPIRIRTVLHFSYIKSPTRSLLCGRASRADSIQRAHENIVQKKKITKTEKIWYSVDLRAIECSNWCRQLRRKRLSGRSTNTKYFHKKVTISPVWRGEKKKSELVQAVFTRV